MRDHCLLLAIVVCFLFAANGFAQVNNATLSGATSDASSALIPGVEITAKHTDTGVVSTTVSNESGTYRFESLQPGPYEVTAALPGFQSRTFRLTLETGQQIQQNFTLQVGGVTQEVEVSVAADQLLTAVSSSIGDVLPEKQVLDLPLVGRNVMNFATMMPGVIGNGGANTTFAGITAGGGANVNLQLDGMSVNTGRFATGLATATFISPDMVEEVRVVVADVDPEGRGSAQIQMRTKSGTNQFRGALTLNLRNSVFDANTWSNNRQGIAPNWYNRPQYSASLGGPIVRNKTFFFGVFDGQAGSLKQTISSTVLTDTARQGIFRFFPGVNNGNTESTPSGLGTTSAVAPVVDVNGNPLPYTQIPGATGPMQSFSIYGDSLNPGDPFRKQIDRTGFMTKYLGFMPSPNAFNGGDGLNTATIRWRQRTIAGPAGTGGTADAFRREQYHIKIDHHFNQKNTLTGTWIQEYNYSDNTDLPAWPQGFSGTVATQPKVMTVRLTSTLSPSLLNEASWGYNLTNLVSLPPFLTSQYGAAASSFLTNINSIPVILNPLVFPTSVLNCLTGSTCNEIYNHNPLQTYTDSLSWIKGVHAIKAGVQFRYASSSVEVPSGLIPSVAGGAGAIAVTGINKVPGLLASNITLAQNLLLSLTGSVQSINEKFEIREPTDTVFQDYRTTYNNPANPAGTHGATRDWHQNEFNFFIKDDWRVTPRLTLNLGVHYDLMRVPYLLSASGKNMTPGLLGGNQAIFGYSGRSFANWMSGGTPQNGALTQVVLTGSGTQYPKQGIWPSDRNNFAPAVGFSWSVPWGGKDKTTVRGGYQIAYQLPGNSLSNVDGDIGKATPGLVYQPTDSGNGTFRDYTNLTAQSIPLPVPLAPFATIPLTDRSQNINLFAPDYTTPYVQTFTFGVTRSLATNLTLDVRYIGTRGVKLVDSINLNDSDFRNNGLLQALQITQAGGNAPLFDQMFKGLNLGSGVVGPALSGSQALRANSSFNTLIANGNFLGVARLLNTTNVGTVQPTGVSGGTLRSSGLFPENFFVVNPQFAAITYRNNTSSSTYHSLQTQLTIRPTHGFNYQTTYTWSRSLGLVGPYRDLLNQRADYGLLANNRTHDLRNFGTFDLPLGPGQLLAGKSSGWFARVIERWKIGTILTVGSGAPLNVGSAPTLYAATGTPDIVGAFPRKGKVVWPLNKVDIFGNFFGQNYQRVLDPSCAALAANIKAFCTSTALADANGNIVLQNARPGQLGTLGLGTINGPGLWNLDANIQKSVRLTESKSLTLRMDASNVFNHPTPGAPNLNINSGTFGQITAKNGNRMLAGEIRLAF